MKPVKTAEKKASTRRDLYRRPACMLNETTHYCQGCGHGTVHRLLAELIDELDIRGKTVGIAPVGCAVLAYDYIDIDWSEAAHGRPPAVATGLKRANPDNVVISYQGDGDLASIGMAETVHAANRGENFTIVFINNALYGMTQGQMAPTTLVGQETTTTPRGRDPDNEGHPIDVCQMLSSLEGLDLAVRTTVTTPQKVKTTKKWLRKALRWQLEGGGLGLVEILAACPTYWRMSPSESNRHIEETMTETFPLQVYKDDTDLDGQE